VRAAASCPPPGAVPTTMVISFVGFHSPLAANPLAELASNRAAADKNDNRISPPPHKILNNRLLLPRAALRFPSPIRSD
jgi:hypothetical protein